MDETNEKKELRLEHRHVAFFFLGAVAVCAIFFALGFVVGRGQAYEVVIKKESSAGVAEKLQSSNKPVSESNTPQEPAGAAASSKEMAVNSGHVGTTKDESIDYRKELNFYSAVKEEKVAENFHPQAEVANRRSGPNLKEISKAEAVAPGGSSLPSISPTGSLVSLQVAAMRNARDADRLAKRLRSKGYPVFIVSPGQSHEDKLIRIQIGPFTNNEEAAKIKARLRKDGYRAILKR